MTGGILCEFHHPSATVLAPGAGDTLCPFKDIDEPDCAGVFEGEGC